MICLLLFFTYLIFSCENKKEASPLNVISVASTVGYYNILNLSEYVTEIKYIPLETNNSVLVSEIRQIIYENEKILILDLTSGLTQNCYLFDSNGKFFWKIGQRGQGPEEYISLKNISIQENFIFLIDQSKILIYDANGYWVKNINLRANEIPAKYRQSSLFEILPLKKDTFVMNVATVSEYFPQAVLFETYQSYLRIIKEYPNCVKLDKLIPRLSTVDLGIMYRFQDDVRVYKAMNDTVFTIGQNMGMKASFIFELGKYGPPLSFYEAKEKYLDGIKKYIIPSTIFESLNHLFIDFSFGSHAPEPVEGGISFITGEQTVNTHVLGIFNKFTGEFTLMKQPIKGKLGFKNDIDNGPVIWPHYISSNNELVTYISVEEFMDYYDKIETPTLQMTEIAQNGSMDDNQIVIFAKLKE